MAKKDKAGSLQCNRTEKPKSPRTKKRFIDYAGVKYTSKSKGRNPTPGHLSPQARSDVAKDVLHRDMSIRAASIKYGIDRKIVRLWVGRAEDGEDMCDRPHPGRPAKLVSKKAIAEARKLCCKKSKVRVRSTGALRKQMAKRGHVMSRTSIRRLAKAAKISRRRRQTQPCLTPQQKKARVAFAKKWRSKSADWWSGVLWTDETPCFFQPQKHEMLIEY
jgi:transposase